MIWQTVGAEDGLNNWVRAAEDNRVGAVRVRVEGVMEREAGAAADCRSRDERAADAIMDFDSW